MDNPEARSLEETHTPATDETQLEETIEDMNGYTMRRWLVLLSLVLVVIFLAAFMVLSQSQENEGDPAPIDPALRAQLDELDATTARLRGLPMLRPVARAFPTTSEAEQYLRALLDDELTPDILVEADSFYQAFDFIPDEMDLKRVYGDLLASQVAGFYDPETQTMNVLLLSSDELSDSLPLLEQVLYVHEFTHALQDQHYALDPFYTAVEESNDQLLARQALVEGDATLVMQNFMLEVVTERPLAALSLVFNEAALNAEIPPGTPKILENELLMPYMDGLQFVTFLHNEGGNAAVDRAFKNPPVSTEQVLHPARYLSGDQPIPVALASMDATDVLGANWSLVLEDTLGEFYLREYLKTQLANDPAYAGAHGWGGDRYALFHNGDQRAWVLRLAWDTSGDRTEFVGIFNNFVQSRYANNLQTARFSPAECWYDQNDAYCRQILGDQIIVTYAPDVELSMALMASQTGG